MAFGNSTQDDAMMSEINVTPLVDVMLVLLVVFIVTAPLLAPQSLKITLPKTESVAPDNAPQKVSVAIDARGSVSVGAAPVTDAALAELLKQRAADPRVLVQIQADEAASYGRVAQVMAIAQKAGVSKLSFLTLARK